MTYYILTARKNHGFVQIVLDHCSCLIIDDHDDFIDVVSEHFKNYISISLEELNNNLFVPFELHIRAFVVPYINDIANLSHVIFAIIFADDTNIFISGKNLNNMINKINKELKKLVEWLLKSK